MKIILTSVYNSDRWRWLEWNRNVRNFNLCNWRIYSYKGFYAPITAPLLLFAFLYLLMIYL